jgi:hypothetical protein
VAAAVVEEEAALFLRCRNKATTVALEEHPDESGFEERYA